MNDGARPRRVFIEGSMSGPPDNFLPALPPGIDEVDLLAWVEGDPLPRNREVAVARLLSEHPALARRLEAMRGDRDAVRDLPADERAPAGLMQGVDAALQPLLERQTLLGLQDGDLADPRPPISLVVPPRRSIVDLLLRDRMGRRMALAAALLLAVGSGTYFAAMMFSLQGRQPSSIGPLAVHDQPLDDATSFDRPGPAIPAPALEDAVALAAAPERQEPGEPTEIEAPAQARADLSRAETLPEPADEDLASATALAAPAPLPMDSGEALRLAREQRLVIRVRLGEGALRPDRVADRLRRAGSPGWRYAGEAPLTVAMQLAPPETFAPPAVVRPGETWFGTPAGVPSGALYGPPAPGIALDLQRSGPAVYTVQSRLDPASLDSLRTALRGVAADVIFEEADPEIIARHEATILAPSAVLWWGQSPSAWVRWTTVPIVVEPAR
jgi:hypothetical protein